MLPWNTEFGSGEILFVPVLDPVSPSSYSPCGVVPLAGESTQFPHRAGQLDPFIPVIWNWMEKHLVRLMSISDWRSPVLGEVPEALSCLWVEAVLCVGACCLSPEIPRT